MAGKLFVTVIAAGFDRKAVEVCEEIQDVDLFGERAMLTKGKKLRQRRQILEKVISENYVPEDLKIPTFLRNQAEASIQ